MKKTILIMLFAFLCITQSSSQEYEYVPFVREGVKWICDEPYSHVVYFGHHYFTLELSGDTVINGKSYKAMHKYSGDAINKLNDTIPVYLREDNKVIYGIVPDGKTYPDCPVGMNWWPEAREVIESGQEFILYDFNDPVNFIKDNFKYPVEGTPNGYYVRYVLTDQIDVAGKEVNCYTFDSSFVIEGIGCDGYESGYPLSPLYKKLYFVIDNGDTTYITKDTFDWYLENKELPIPRQRVQWVNERVTVENGDTTLFYYKYEFRGCDSQGFALCYDYSGETLDGSAAQLVAQYQSWDYGLDTSNGMIRRNIPFEKVKREGRDMIDYDCGLSYGYWFMYHFDIYSTVIDDDYTPNWYISRQKDSFLTPENLIEVDPLIIERILCRRFAYIGEQGDTLAYIVQGIGFDSRDMGDLLTPFTRKPDPDADYQEYCGLSHVIKDGKIIYKGMRYREGAYDGINEVVADQCRVMDDNYYDLMGRVVGKDVPTVPGIYIHQGKKICVSRLP